MAFAVQLTRFNTKNGSLHNRRSTKSKLVKTWKRIVALIGIATGGCSLGLGVLTWLLISRGPFPSGSIRTEHGDIPFAWGGEMTWWDYVIVAALTMLGIAVIAVSYRFGFRQRAS
jgi:hypothetical protein